MTDARPRSSAIDSSAPRGIALSAATVSAPFRQGVEKRLGHPLRWTILREWRQRGAMGALRAALGESRQPLYVVCETTESEVVTPLLSLLALPLRARGVFLVEPSGAIRPLALTTIAEGVFGFVRASIGVRIATWRNTGEARRLSRGPRAALSAGDSPHATRSIAYLRPALWFGVQAGGSVGHIAGVANGFAARGLDVRFFGPDRPAMLRPFVTSTLVAPPPGFGAPAEANIDRYQRRFVKVVSQALAERPPSVLYQRVALGDFSGAVLAHRLGVPLIAEYNGSEVWVAEHWGDGLANAARLRLCEDALLKQAHVIVVISKALRDELVDRGHEAHRIVCHPNGIDPELFDPSRYDLANRHSLRDSIGIPRDALVATFIGTFGRWHGAEVLAQAIGLLVRDDRAWLEARKLRFCLVGDGLRMPDVRERIARDGSGPWVTTTGLVPQDQGPRYLAMSDLLLSPHVANADGSRFFGSPTKLFEYMAMGKPIIASDLEQIGEVLRPAVEFAQGGEATIAAADDPSDSAAVRRRAVLVTPGDAAMLAAAIKALVDRPRLGAALGQAARDAALGEFTWDHHVASILDAVAHVR